MRRIFIILSILCLPVIAGSQEKWNGGIRYDYTVGGRNATVVVPQVTAPGSPWIWRPAFFDAFPSVDIMLLKEGWHIAYYDVTHCYGSPVSVKAAREFYDDAVGRFGLSDKVTLEGFSRGGYFCFAWAEAYPETVSSLYVDAPVCDILSWPGRNNADLWEDFLKNWNITDDDVTECFKGNALMRLPALAASGIPIISVCGGADLSVPFNDNFRKVREKYQEMGGVVELILKPECGHHPHSLENPEPVVDFVKRYAKGYDSVQDIHFRGSLDNSMHAMTVRKKACVAFLGGSITEMRGWRDMVKDDLRQRFPDTEFDFIDAGIASLGSTPHAFRFEKDVLQKGIPDLLFVEAAVNDDTNGFSACAQVRGMEGIFRHALKANPMMDIVMLDFIYDPFLILMGSGEMPDVVLNHERVANRYHVTSVNMVSEIHSRIKSGELTWEKFGGTHPAWNGHKYYCAAINRILDASTRPVAEYVMKPHAIPDPLDKGAYSSGKLVSVREAYRLRGFSVEESWSPGDGAGTRNGFTDVTMLSTDRGGSFSFDFTGTAVGIFCVAGPDSGLVRFRIDRGEWRQIDTYTQWSGGLYLPWLYVLGENLPQGSHTLEFRTEKGCHIRDFAVNAE